MPFGPMEVNLEAPLENDGDPLVITTDEAVAAHGVPPGTGEKTLEMVFKKGLPLTKEMSAAEKAKLCEDGTLKAHEDKRLKYQTSMMSEDSSPPPLIILNLDGFRGLLLFPSKPVSMVLVLLVSSVYIVHENYYGERMETLRSDFLKYMQKLYKDLLKYMPKVMTLKRGF